jgi:hypothetical protein
MAAAPPQGHKDGPILNPASGGQVIAHSNCLYSLVVDVQGEVDDLGGDEAGGCFILYIRRVGWGRAVYRFITCRRRSGLAGQVGVCGAGGGGYNGEGLGAYGS